MEWLNEPASWQRIGDVLTVSVDPGTDFWCETGYGYIRDNGHVYGEVLAGDFDVSVRVRGTFAVQYDQAGIMLRADDRTWLKTGVEFFEGHPRLSTVLTLGRSSWVVTDLPEGLDEILLRASRRGDAVEVRYLIGDGPAELAALVSLPPGREYLAGVACAAPESPGFRVSFHDLHITERDWSRPAATGGGWPGEGEPAWAGQDSGSSWAGAEESKRAWGAGEDGVEDAAEGGPGWAGDVPAAHETVDEAREAAGDWARPAGDEAEADWDRLAAGADSTAPQERRWGAETDADVADEWPGPPQRGPAGLAGPPDPADEWISLLTADPAEE